MATRILSNGYLSFNAVVLSDHVQQMEVPEGVDSQDFTAMGADTKVAKPGLKTWQIKATLFQDYVAGSVDATISAALGTIVPIEVRPDAGAVAVGNPKWTGTGFVSAYNPIAGEVGGRQTCEITIEAASTLVRATA